MKKGLVFVLAFALVSVVTAQSTSGLTLRFEDDFSNNKNGWNLGLGGNEVSFINYSSKALVLDGNKNSGVARVTMKSPIGFNQDFVLKATVWCQGCAGEREAFFGLLFGQSSFEGKGNEGYYSVRLAQNNGQDAVSVRVNNSNGSILYERDVNAPFDPDDRNDLAIERTGDTINIYLNGNVIYTNVVTETSGNEITYITSDKNKVFMSNLTLWTK
jgi:hypothetical protein